MASKGGAEKVAPHTWRWKAPQATNTKPKQKFNVIEVPESVSEKVLVKPNFFQDVYKKRR